MNILFNIYLVIAVALYVFIISHSIRDLYKSIKSRNKSLYPLTKPELVNVTRTSDKKKGGK